MTAAQVLETVIAALIRRAGGTKRDWRLVIGPVRVHDRATHPHCNWSVAPSGSAGENALVEDVLDDLRLVHPIVEG